MGIKRIAVFVSGGGTNLQSLIDGVESGKIANGKIEIVFSNNKEAFGLKRAEKHNIETLRMDMDEYGSREEFDRALAEKMNEKKINLICLAGYMKIFTKEFIDTFKGSIMNIHPALLPGFGGKGMYGMNVHRAVIESREKESGCTVHFVDYGTDTGPVILRRKVEVKKDDTPETLQKRVLEQEHIAYTEAVSLFCGGKLKVENGKVIINP